ncbi:helix-turn-helix domain-containing protein [Pontibacillus sp. ALD_SL1]|uniref:CdaR family transcriptional regulator n=1 Tax=Pontibacillus sp. ALD_SL1 TaxID=2777185 RepID=UPI001A970A3F|nr:sugar diacid recognition domain-containing protein [Pontibacillus sp. ALD_SL1]QST01029.1 helix-turn-helix domain-containing protein [Pontibacillus sp. ALD_SL1]
MLISQEVAQSIVLETEAVMNRNINVMDAKGRIIASVDEERIGDYHEGAAEVIRTEESVVIHSGNAYRGAKPGMNLPVRLHHQVIGVIGITGDPAEVEQLGVLLQRMTEILIKEAHLDEQLELENQARETFVNEWLLNRYDDEKFLATRGWMFHINIYKSRVAVLLELTGFQEYWYRQIESGRADVHEEVNMQRYRRQVERLIHKYFPEEHEHVLVPDGSARYIILLSVSEKEEPDQRKERVAARVKKIQDALLQTYKQSSVAGIGNMCSTPSFMSKSVEEADRALRYARDHGDSCFFYEELGLESFMYDLPVNIREDFLNRILQPEALASVPDAFLTLDTFYSQKGSINAAADRLHIHKNTLQYRLRRIWEITGYDPRDLNDSTLFQTALAFYKIHGRRH